MRQILGWSENKMRRDKIARGGYFSRKEFRKRIAEAKPAPYTKHTRARTEEKAKEISSTGKNPPAQYLPDVDNEKLEREALRKAEYIYIDENNKGAIYFIYDTGRVIGYDNGKRARWIRAELSLKRRGAEYHGHPMSKERAESYLKRSIRRSDLMKE